MPKWEETVEGCRERYVNIVKALADKYPTENLLLVTHGKNFLLMYCVFSSLFSFNELCGELHSDFKSLWLMF